MSQILVQRGRLSVFHCRNIHCGRNLEGFRRRKNSFSSFCSQCLIAEPKNGKYVIVCIVCIREIPYKSSKNLPLYCHGCYMAARANYLKRNYWRREGESRREWHQIESLISETEGWFWARLYRLHRQKRSYRLEWMRKD